MFKFPDNARERDLYKAWYNKIKKSRRKGGKDLFTVTNNTYVCEFHFAISDIQVIAGRHIKTLKDKAIPSIFTFKKMSTPVMKRKYPKNRHLFQDLAQSKHPKGTDEDDSIYIPPIADDQISTCENCNELSSENILLKEKIMALEEENHKVVEDLKLKESVINGSKKNLLSYDNFAINEKLFRTATGLEVEKFNILMSWTKLRKY